MPFPLQKHPRGLIELLNLRGLPGAGAPQQFGEAVLPVIEASAFYGVDLLRTGALVGTAGAFPRVVTQTVTVGPNLYLNFGGNVVIGAAGGTWVHWRIDVRQDGAAPFATLAAETHSVLPAGRSRAFGFMVPQPFILPSGAEIRLICDSDAAGADHTATLTLTLIALSTG